MELKRIIESAGGEFLRVEAGTVFFSDRETGVECSLYLSAVEPATVALTLKHARESAGIYEEIAR